MATHDWREGVQKHPEPREHSTVSKCLASLLFWSHDPYYWTERGQAVYRMTIG
jgi:hypothetical protein